VSDTLPKQGENPDRIKTFNEQILKIRGFVNYHKIILNDYLTVVKILPNGKKLASHYMIIPKDNGPLSIFDNSYIRTETDYSTDIVIHLFYKSERR
jgi:hypothetical protein